LIMPNVAVTSFNNGEVTRHIDARGDVEKYASSCRTLENMLPLIYGDAARRPGTKYIATAKNSPQGVRLVPFIYSSEIAYMCEFGDLYIRFYHDGAPLLDVGGVHVETASPYLVADLPQLQYRQIADTMWLVHPNYAPQKLTRTTVTSFSLDEIVFENGPFLTRNDIAEEDDVTMTSSVTTKAATGTLTASAATFENEHIGALWKLVQPRANTVVTLGITAIDESDELAVKGTFTFTTHGTWTATVVLKRSADGGTTWDAYRTWIGVDDKNVSFAGTETEDDILYRIDVTAWTSHTTATADLSVDLSTQDGIVRIDGIASPTVANITVLSALASTNSTTRWAEGAWSRVRGYPTAITFFESRIIYGGTDYEPQTLWLSATDDYEDFEAGVNDADSFSVTLAATNRIRWIEALETLAIGTSGDEWRVSSDKLDSPLTPTNFGAKIQSTYGGKDLQAVRVNTAVLFVDYVGRKVREFTFSADQQKYVAPDLTALAEHITESGIVSLAHQKSPDSILWCVRADGTLLSMTYEREQNVVAWARHLVGLTQTESTDVDLTVISAVDAWGNIVTGSGGSLGVMLYDQAYQQILRTRSPPYSFTYHVHQDINGNFYTGQKAAGAGTPVKLNPQLEVVTDWPAYTNWGTSSSYYVYSVRPTHDGEYVYVVSQHGSYIAVTKLTADTGDLVWRQVSAGYTAPPYDIGVLSNGDVIVPNWIHYPASIFFPIILASADGTRVSNYYDATSLTNRGGGGNYRICVVESIGKWFTCGVNRATDEVRGAVMAFHLGDTYQLNKAWNFDPVPGNGTNTCLGVVYKDGYVYAVGNRVVYGGGYACVWKINAETGALVASADLGFGLQDIFLKNDLTLVAVRESNTDTWTELTDDLVVISQTDRDVAPVTNQTIWRAEAVPDPIFYPGAPTVNILYAEATGAVESVATIPGDTEDEVWISVLRTVNGSTARYIERMQPRTFDEQADAFFVDCGIIYDGDPTDTFTGLDHLEGEIVAVLGDGAVFATEEVSGGAITIANEVSKAAIGLPFRFTLKPMRLDQLYANAPRGASKGSFKKIAELVISFLDTLNAKYGTSADELFPIEWRTTEAHDTPPALYTGDIVVPFDGGFDPEDPIVISGEDPLPCTVRAIIARLDVVGR